MKFHLHVLSFIGLSALFLTSGCGDDITKPQEEHFEAEGMIIYDGNTKIYEYFAPDYGADDEFTNDTIHISTGRTNLLTAKFLDENRNEIDPPDGEQTLGAEIGNADLVSIEWNDGENGAFSFYLNGRSPGITTIKFQILHEGHPDFTTLANYITVDP